MNFLNCDDGLESDVPNDSYMLLWDIRSHFEEKYTYKKRTYCPLFMCADTATLNAILQ